MYVRFLDLLLRNRTTFIYLSATPLMYAEEIRDFLSIMQNNRVYRDQADDLERIYNKIEQLESEIKATSRDDFIQQAIQKLIIPEDI